MRGVLVSALIWVMAGPVSGECASDEVLLRGSFGEARFSIELADDPDERATGLMHRTEMASGAGMLFVYERSQKLSFWMHNTLIPLDMLFIDETGTVRRIHHNAKPLDKTSISGGRGIAVLEINGGLARRMGIKQGTQVRHPAFADGPPAWPC